ncbi:MAG: hypothetical protein M0R74_07285, partial [Dehalococcoidia bacterium]|nr:hypothetical protein [Dehalococcoidia bacterium]
MLANPLRPPAPQVVYSPWRPNLWVLVVTSAAVLGLLLGSLSTLVFDRGPLARYEYHLWRWQADTLLDNVFSRLGIGPSPGDADGEAVLREYFALTSQLRAASEADPPDVALLETLANERATYENDVERLIERYIHEAAVSAGLEQRLPLFREVSFVWPPVDFELTEPPRLLVRSPRDTIRRAGDTLLKPDLTLRDIAHIEERTDSAETVSLVISIGGLAAYPAIVRDDRSYQGILDTAAHEWVHHYLAFFPLGQQWGKGGDAETLNETTANIAGRELANIVNQRHPVVLPPGADGGPPPRPAPSVDFNAEMRALRLQVDDLLAAGKIDEAERLMEERRQFLAEHGITIRKINQAYFAFYGTYADT